MSKYLFFVRYRGWRDREPRERVCKDPASTKVRSTKSSPEFVPGCDRGWARARPRCRRWPRGSGGRGSWPRPEAKGTPVCASCSSWKVAQSCLMDTNEKKLKTAFHSTKFTTLIFLNFHNLDFKNRVNLNQTRLIYFDAVDGTAVVRIQIGQRRSSVMLIEPI